MRPYRLIVRRTRLTGPQATLWPDWRYHAFVPTARAARSPWMPTTAAMPSASWPSATLKDGAGLRHCPSAPHTVMFGLGVLVVAIWRSRSAARAAPAAA
jgi:hypothetical protein